MQNQKPYCEGPNQDKEARYHVLATHIFSSPKYDTRYSYNLEETISNQIYTKIGISPVPHQQQAGPDCCRPHGSQEVHGFQQ